MLNGAVISNDFEYLEAEIALRSGEKEMRRQVLPPMVTKIPPIPAITAFEWCHQVVTLEPLLGEAMSAGEKVARERGAPVLLRRTKVFRV